MNTATKLRFAILATHPIQYHAPIFRALAERDDISPKVFFASDMSIRGYDLKKEGFGVTVKWDVPLLEGYKSTFLNGCTKFENCAPFFKYDRPEIARVLKSGEFDVLLLCCSYTLLLTLRAVAAARKAGIPVLIRGDNTDGDGQRRSWLKERIRRIFLRGLYSRLSGFLPVGKYMHKHFIAHGVTEEKIFMSPHCVDDVRFNEDRIKLLPKRHEIRKRLGFDAKDFIFLFSGRLVKKKNTPLLSEALEKLAVISSTGLLVVGDGEDRPTVQNRTQKILGKKAVFVGFKNQSELAEYYVAADALIICSSFGETWGLVVNEAQIFGLPVIASDRVGCREDLVIEGETGLVFPSGDAVALAECMQRLSSDQEFAKRMGRAARERSLRYRVADAVEGIVKATCFVNKTFILK